MESFLKDYEKTPGYRSAFEFKNKMFASMRSQRTALVPLFKLGDDITRIKRDVEDTMGSCGAVIAPRDNPDAGHLGWGEETITAVYRPLQLPPQIDIDMKPDEIDLDDLDLDPNTAATIQERVQEKNNRNRVHALKAMNFSVGLIKKL